METIKEGDFVQYSVNPKNPIRRVIKRNGILGVELEGWFSWMPISKHHIKVKPPKR